MKMLLTSIFSGTSSSPVVQLPPALHRRPATSEELKAHARELAQFHGDPGTGVRNRLLRRLAQHEHQLKEHIRELQRASQAGQRLSPAAVWLLDNYMLIQTQVTTIRRLLPRSYCRKLPTIGRGPHVGLPRIFVLVCDFISRVDGRVEQEQVESYLLAYQSEQELTIGELWATSIMLRLALIDSLSQLSVQVVANMQDTMRAAQWAQRFADMAHEHSPLIFAELGRSLTNVEAPSATFIAELRRRLRGIRGAEAVVNSWLAIHHLYQDEDPDLIETRQLATDQHTADVTFTSIRALDEVDWRTVVERCSVVEQLLCTDPANIYADMDEVTRDSYRHRIEVLSRQAQQRESSIVRQALELAFVAKAERRHVGTWLVAEAQVELERRLGLYWHPSCIVARYYRRFAARIYMLAVISSSMVAATVLLAVMDVNQQSWWWYLALWFISLGAVSQPMVQFTAWCHARWLPTVRLPRLALADGLQQGMRTLVVVPTMLKHRGDGFALARSLEVRYLGNRDPLVAFALLTDFGDAAQEMMSGDEIVLSEAEAAIQALNHRYGDDADNGPFLLLHRPRIYVANECCWMGRERKRGKLEDLNHLLLRGEEAPFSRIVGDRTVLTEVRYVIVLDTDTLLPPGTMRRLVATMAHPLNQPRHAEDGRVIAGHAVLQPRVAINCDSAARSRFSVLSSPEPGIDSIDIYAGTAADLWQDLCDNGSFIGKGIYDVAAFERAVGTRFPTNTVLSHDLIEGCYARSGLVNDVALVEDHPASLLVDRARRHRWMRGDWQIAGWLLPWVSTAVGSWSKNTLDLVSRFKIADNLRRALVPPLSLAVILIDVLSGGGLATVVLISLWLLTPAVASVPMLVRRAQRVRWRVHFSNLVSRLLHEVAMVGLMIAMLPSEAWLSLHAMFVAGYRTFISKRHRLAWVTAHDSERIMDGSLWGSYRTLFWGPLLAGGLVVFLMLTPDVALITYAIAGLLSLVWLAGPLVSWWLSLPRIQQVAELEWQDRRVVSMTARATWHYFESYVTAADHWLPPDNVQKLPVALTAHRTSPTNIGMGLLANVAAHDLGYLPTDALVTHAERQLGTLEQLDRYRGHFYNWYDTRTLAPLPPRYVSTVDSGNLVAGLILLAQGMQDLPDQRPDPRRLCEGLLSATELLAECCRHSPQCSGLIVDLRTRLDDMPPLALTADWCEAIAQWLVAHEDIFCGVNDDAKGWVQALIRQADGWAAWYRRVGWVGSSDAASLGEIAQRDQEHAAVVRLVLERAHRVAERAQRLADDMDFTFLYRRQRRLLSIGMQVEDGHLDRSCYDLLASEARLTSYLAIASGQLPIEHWFALGRPLVDINGQPALVSWSGSMFEYLMPALVMPEFPNTLLANSLRAMLKRQIAYAEERGVPWGISESGYHLTDAAQQWQYRAFGVPGLGLKSGLDEDLVIAPYAAIIALVIDPTQACKNLRRLRAEGMFGNYGFYEAVDYTAGRLPPGSTSAQVQSWMAHHQGMSLLACLHVLADAPMQARFRANPQLRSLDVLLQERAPRMAPVERELEELHAALPTEETAGVHVVAHPNPRHPEASLLSNGRYHVLITSGGGGVSRWREWQLNRWHADHLDEGQGLFCYLHDVERNVRWSNTAMPSASPCRTYEAIFTQAQVEFRRRDHDIECTTIVAVAGDDDIELRRMTLVNRSGVPRTIEVTTCTEPVVGKGDADLAHQSFAALSIDISYDVDSDCVLVTRRRRRADDPRWYAVHRLSVHGADCSAPSMDSDRRRFIGRGRTMRNPAALDRPGPLPGIITNPLDGIVAVRRRILLQPGVPVIVDAIWGFAENRDQACALAACYGDRIVCDRVAGVAWGYARLTLHRLGISEELAQAAARLVASLALAHPARRAAAGIVALNRRPQSALWAHGLSGDLPLFVLRTVRAADESTVQELIGMQAWWRSKGLFVDCVIWDEDVSSYRSEREEKLTRLIESAGVHPKHEGVLVMLRADQITDEDRIAIMSAAQVVLDASHGSMYEQILRRSRLWRPMPTLEPPRAQRSRSMSPVPIPGDLQHANGLGGFATDGSYVIVLDPGATTPAPWCNVLANDRFGALISAHGAGFTWTENSQSFRISPWPQDAVGEIGGEALYLRDEEDGSFWSPTPWPARAPARYVVRHEAGKSTFTCHHDDLQSELTTAVVTNQPARLWRWRLTNRGERMRHLSVLWYADAVLGDQRRRESPFVITSVDPTSGALLARNPHHPDHGNTFVVLNCSSRDRHVSGDRLTVRGRNNGWDAPEAMLRVSLDDRTGAALDPCLAMQAEVHLAPGQEREVIFVLAAGNDLPATLDLAAQLCQPGSARTAEDAITADWQQRCAPLQVHTGDKSVDLLVNSWLPYQVIACRLWARSGWYQSGGAYGFRDQLQDAMGIAQLDADILRAQILRCAARQFSEGDVQHWWHPDDGRGVRTHCSDDMIWLPAAVTRYIDVTKDESLLEVQVPYLMATQPMPATGDLYERPLVSQEYGTIYDHCLRALHRAINVGEHGLPLIGSGDWNDGFDRLGLRRRGESVWLAMFLIKTLADFIPLAKKRGDQTAADELSRRRGELRLAADEAWDGAWYRRAYDDDGRPIGSSENTACRIDILPQAWSVICEAPDTMRNRQAMHAVENELVDTEGGLIRLFAPPFSEESGDPGYIRGYPDGIRENGGQYTHAAVWAILAQAELGDAKRAWSWWQLIDPIRRGADARRLSVHCTEPYVLCGDVYSTDPWRGRGGWSWYTGSAAWLYRVTVEHLLGLRQRGTELTIEPLVPATWETFTMTMRYQGATYVINVQPGSHRTILDDVELDKHTIHLCDDGGIHYITVWRPFGDHASTEHESAKNPRQEISS